MIPDPTTGLVYRYLFDADKNPLANGTITVSSAGSVAFSPLGEMFVSSNDLAAGGIYRFVFDGHGQAISNGFMPG